MRTAVVHVSGDATIWEAAVLMTERGINRLPVVDEEGFLSGVISRADIVRIMGDRSDKSALTGTDTATRAAVED
jgi:CBS domain-containing protein